MSNEAVDRTHTGEPSLISVEEHRDYVARLLSRTPVEWRQARDCVGLALAEDLTAAIPLPPFDNSAMDGYAVRATDLAAASEERPAVLRITEDVPAGRVEVPELQPGTAHRIMTGAQLAPGADTVVPVERTGGNDTSWAAAEVTIHGPLSPGSHVRRAGEDTAVGTAVLVAGSTLGAAQLGVAAAIGANWLPVHRAPRVLVLSTGSELVEPGTPLHQGQIYESNGVMLATALREAGCRAELLRFVPDDVEQFHSALAPHLTAVDLILTSGGVSAGAYEVVKDALENTGVRFTKVAMQPGMPQGAGFYRRDAGASPEAPAAGVPVVTLPGNPVSALVSFEVFVRPALLAAAGHRVTGRPRMKVALAEALTSPRGKRQYRRGRLDPDGGTVLPHGGAGSHLISAMAGSDCLVEVPPETTELDAGSQVWVHLLS